MSNYVVDASIVITYLIQEAYTSYVEAFFDQATPTDTLSVPEFCLLECANVIWKQVRFHNMMPQQARLLLRDLRTLPLKRAPVKRLLDTALDIGMRHQLVIYDSAYIALAQRSAYPLITADEPQRRAALAEGISLKPITDFTP